VESQYCYEEDKGHPCEVCSRPVFIAFKRDYAGHGTWLKWVAQRAQCETGCLRRGDQLRLNRISLGRT
jgi:hypothetical protein